MHRGRGQGAGRRIVRLGHKILPLEFFERCIGGKVASTLGYAEAGWESWHFACSSSRTSPPIFADNCYLRWGSPSGSTEAIP